ncbi:MAG: hypothetical protein COA79_08440 [Planctomycetota bacterium]|nr:MAG: hypothetical protein COA79_08440 [Planctomycetota bacterium]
MTYFKLSNYGQFTLVSILIAIFNFSNHSSYSQDELLVKRKGIYEFTKKPTIKKSGDNISISFTSKDYCDVTIAIEDSSGKIIRHLISGVLGKNSPAPLKKNSLSQTVVWNCKNDQGKYVLSYEDLTVRVSLGIKPMYEKDLYSNPKRRQGREAPVLKSTKEGVYVYDGGTGFDFVKLFSADGEYIKTIYPFPGNKIKDVKGLHILKRADGAMLPLKPTFMQQTFLTSGNYHGYTKRKKEFYYPKHVEIDDHHYGMYWYASSFLAVEGGKIALGMDYLNRFATDGTSGGMDIYGPPIAMTAAKSKFAKQNKIHQTVTPRSGALSPDGKTLYLAGYHFCKFGKASADIILPGSWHSYHAVYKMELKSDKKPKLFLGSPIYEKNGKDNNSFYVPAHVATDAKGNVYVSDHLNHRVQVYSSEGTFISTLKVPNPSQVVIEPYTQKIYAVSSMIYVEGRGSKAVRRKKVQAKITVFSSAPHFNNEKVLDLPNKFNKWVSPGMYRGNFGFPLSVAVLKNKGDINVWISREWTRENILTVRKGIKRTNIHIFTIKANKLILKDDFGKEIAKQNIMNKPAKYNRPRIYFNPKNKKLYLTEGRTNYQGKAFKQIREINPETGKTTVIPIPFDAEDMCFDHDGYIYLRNLEHVIRYDMSKKKWREVPWDYGNEAKSVHTSSSSDRKMTDSVSALKMTGSNGGWHHGGMYVALNGNIAVGCINSFKDTENRFPFTNFKGRSFAGRGGTPYIMVWNKYGKPLYVDFVPGLAANTYGVGLDTQDNIYLMSSGTRIYNQKKHHSNESGTLMKFPPKKGKILSTGKKVELKLDPENYLKRDYDISNPSFGNAWVIGSEWMYGGVGWSGKNGGLGCSCWNARFTMDYFNRSFAPEISRFSIAMLDSAGNLITRIGTYGNTDAQGPKSKAPVGGDEVGLMHGAYVAVHTDNRLFIADPANQKIISAKLGYHKEERLSLKQFQEKE